MALEETTIRTRMARYADPAETFETLKAEGIGPIDDAARFNARSARGRFLSGGGLAAGRITQLMEHAFDRRWVFYTELGLWNEPRKALAAQQEAGSSFIVTRLQSRKADEGIPVFFTSDLPGDHLFDPNTRPFAVKSYLDAAIGSAGFALHGSEAVPNLYRASSA